MELFQYLLPFTDRIVCLHVLPICATSQSRLVLAVSSLPQSATIFFIKTRTFLMFWKILLTFSTICECQTIQDIQCFSMLYYVTMLHYTQYTMRTGKDMYYGNNWYLPVNVFVCGWWLIIYEDGSSRLSPNRSSAWKKPRPKAALKGVEKFMPLCAFKLCFAHLDSVSRSWNLC